MELRFLEGNFEHGKFKLQMREIGPNKYTDWKDVPCEKEETPRCPCGACRLNCADGDAWYCQTLVVTLQTGMYCQNCGNKLKEAL